MADQSDSSETREDAQLIAKSEAAAEAQLLLRQNSRAVLGTLSKRADGWPFGSVAPYAISRHGEPLILIATIAEHTKNIKADDRVSLLVHDEVTDGDLQAHGRITVMGRARLVADDEVADAKARYLARVPWAESYFKMHDFALYAISLDRVRFIGGFGKIFWLDAASFRLDPANDPLAAAAVGIVEHMNEDHTDALHLYCRAFKDLDPESVEMVGIDAWGFDLHCAQEQRRLRFDFKQPVDPDSVRPAVVQMVKEARAILAG